MNTLHRFFMLGAIAALIAGCKPSTETQLNGGSGNGPGYLYAGTFSDGIFRSTDNGRTWIRANSGLTCDTVYAFASDSTYLFAGTKGEGIFRSSDNGQSWTQVNNGISNRIIGSLLIYGSSLYTGAYSSVGDGCIFRSTDEGENWIPTEFTEASIIPMATMGQFFFASSSDDYDGVRCSSDSGKSWPPINDRLWGHCINVLSVARSTLFAGTTDSLFRSNDSGSNWQSANLQGNIYSFFGNEIVLLAGTEGGLFYSTDNGVGWRLASFSEGLTINALASDGARIFAGINGEGVFVSKDNGANWTAANNGIESEYVMTLAIH